MTIKAGGQFVLEIETRVENLSAGDLSIAYWEPGNDTTTPTGTWTTGITVADGEDAAGAALTNSVVKRTISSTENDTAGMWKAEVLQDMGGSDTRIGDTALWTVEERGQI